MSASTFTAADLGVGVPREGAVNYNPRISALSHFLDAFWNFSKEHTSPTHSKCAKIIRWDFTIRPGERFSDPKFASLMLSCKELLYAMLWHPNQHKRSKSNTVCQRWIRLRHFVIFLVTRKHPILRFKDVTKYTIEEYKKELDLPTKRGKRRGKEILYLFYSVLKSLYTYRHKISDPIQFDPFEGESPSKVLGLSSADTQQIKTEVIPDDKLSKLIISALDYVNLYADFLIEVATQLERIRGEAENASAYSNRAKKYLSRLTPPAAENNGASFSLGTLTAFTVAKHLIRLRTACFILIAFMTAMRIGELLSVEAGCVEKEYTDDGEFIWIHSLLYKTQNEAEGTPTKWIGGPVAARAVSIMERLTLEFRHATGSRRLFVPVTKWGVHTWTGESVSAGDMSDMLKKYACWLGLEDGNGSPFRLTTHMFRRTFARHVVRSDTTNLLALKDHLKHWSLAMTEYYVGFDDELQDYLNEEANRLSYETFDSMMRAERMGGPRGKELVRQIDAAIADGRLPAEFRGEAGAHLRKQMIFEWVEAGQQIYPCGTGNVCWFRKGSALCTDGDRPVVEACNPVGCSNSIVLPEHDPGWQVVEEVGEELLKHAPPGSPHSLRLHKIVGIAKKIRSSIR